MDISKATVDQLLSELRDRKEVIAVKCWVLNDLHDWIDVEIKFDDHGDDEDKERAAFMDAHRDEIVEEAVGNLADLEDRIQDDCQMIDSVMHDAVRYVQVKEYDRMHAVDNNKENNDDQRN